MNLGPGNLDPRTMRKLEHLALEFDSRYAKLLEVGQGSDRLNPSQIKQHKGLLAVKALFRNLYFIDYRIKRRPGTRPGPGTSRGDRQGSRAVFDGNGCRFVEVRCADTEWLMDDGSPLSSRLVLDTEFGPVYEMHELSVFRLIRLIEIVSWKASMVRAFRSDDAFFHSWFWTDEEWYTLNPKLGANRRVLACEMLH